MAVKLGRNARIKLDNTTIARMTSFEITHNSQTIDITSFGDRFSKFASGMLSWTGTITGHMDLDDASQSTLDTAARAGNTIANMRFYIDATTWFQCDTATDAEANLIIDSYSFNTDNNSVVSFTMSVTGSGGLSRETP